MRDRLLRILTILLGVSVAAWVSSLVISTKLTHGDESSDDFRVATIMNGGEFSSHATNLRSGTAITVMGGVRIDLRSATLDPSGASLELSTIIGGLEVLVPEDWAVVVDEDVSGGDSKVDVTHSKSYRRMLPGSASTPCCGSAVRRSRPRRSSSGTAGRQLGLGAELDPLSRLPAADPGASNVTRRG